MHRRMTIFLAVFVFIGCFLLSEATRVRACDVTEYSLDAGGAWARLDTYEHMGSPNTTYTYADTTTRSGYASYVTAGFNAWGVFVSCAETTSNPMGTIGSGYYTGNVLAFAEVESDAGKHVTTWSITVNRMYFDSSLHSEALKTLTLTHEIGHVYGLGHVSDSTQIMYNVDCVCGNKKQ